MRQETQRAERASDPVVKQAEKIFAQRKARALLIDREILGEPGWDILLCAFIAKGNGRLLDLISLPEEIGVAPSTTKRWINILVAREMLSWNGEALCISLRTEATLQKLFKFQLDEALRGTPEN